VGSIIDLTFVSSSLWGQTRWAISEIYTASDHVAIIVDLQRRDMPTSHPGHAQKAYKANTLNPATFAESLIAPIHGSNADHSAALLMKSIEEACDASMQQRKGFKRHHKSIYWWNDEIAEERRKCISARRLLQRSRGRPEYESRRDEYGKRRRSLKKAIRRSKNERFLELCDDAENDTWGLAYKLASH